MRKLRNARTHVSSRAARRPDGLPNRAMFRAMSPLEQVLDYQGVVTRWVSVAANLIPGYVPQEDPHA